MMPPPSRFWRRHELARWARTVMGAGPAERWLTTPAPALGYAAPLGLCDTAEGYDRMKHLVDAKAIHPNRKPAGL